MSPAVPLIVSSVLVASCSSLAAALWFAAASGGNTKTAAAGLPTSAADIVGALGQTAKLATVGPAPSAAAWKSHNENKMGDKKPSSITIVGDVLKKYTGLTDSTYDWNSDFVAKMRAECHANPLATHVEYDFEKRVCWIKNANKVPEACLAGKEKCADGDWKRGTRFSEFHPERGWLEIAEKKWRLLREIDCSSGSSCRLMKIMDALSIAGYVTFFLPFIGEASQFAQIGTTMVGRVLTSSLKATSTALGLVDDLGNAAAVIGILSNARKSVEMPFSNRPAIIADDFWIGTKSAEYKKLLCGTKKATYGTPGYTRCNDQASGDLDKLLLARKKIAYDPWSADAAKWDALPEADGNYSGFKYDTFLGMDAMLGYKVLVVADNGRWTSMLDDGPVSDASGLVAQAQAGGVAASRARAAAPAKATAKAPAKAPAKATTRPAAKAPVARTAQKTTQPRKTTTVRRA